MDIDVINRKVIEHEARIAALESKLGIVTVAEAPAEQAPAPEPVQAAEDSPEDGA